MDKADLSSDYALSCKEPWLYFMLELPPQYQKDIENRKSVWYHRGRLWLHASSMTDEDYKEGIAFARKAGVPKALLPKQEALVERLGFIHGRCDIVDVIHPSPFIPHPLKKSKWLMEGRYGYVTKNRVKVMDPVATKGRIGLWLVPNALLEKLQVMP